MRNQHRGSRTTRLLVVVAVTALVASTVGTATGAAVTGAAPEGAPVDPVTVALAHVADHRDDFGLWAEAVDDLRISDVVPLADIGFTTVYVQQQLHNLDIHNAVSSVTVGRDGTVAHVASRFVPERATLGAARRPALGPAAAVAAAARAVGLASNTPLTVQSSAGGDDRAAVVSPGSISAAPVPVRLVYQPDGSGRLSLAWDVTIDEPGGEHHWSTRVDAVTGAELNRSDWVDHESDPSSLVADGSSYTAYVPPTEAPTFGPRTVVNQPAVDSASPFGWHDTNGVAGPESTLTTGNNVDAYLDLANDDTSAPDDHPIDGGAGLDFNPPIDLTMAPSAYRPAAVTNLFYWNNYVHDLFSAYGFDAASGNFQTNNYGLGGLGNDAVRAEAQDGGGVRNANFSTPPDGSPPRMQMYLFDLSSPARDGDLDNGIVTHEYGHGITNRLTGGPSNVNCLQNTEQMGEGWSDYFALMLTMPDTGSGPVRTRGAGTYALNQPNDGPGVRVQRYSTDNSINTLTYDSIKTLVAPHGVGTVWAEMLWELTWRLIDESGFDPNLLTPSNVNAGNVVALRLVMDGLKLQPCSPGFVDGRDAIIAADQARYGGAHFCAIWEEFAARGLGAGAVQGSTASKTDGTQAFDIPLACQELNLTKTASPDPVVAGGQATFTLTATNTKPVAMANVTITDPVPANTSYVAGSASTGACNGAFSANTVSFTIASIAAGASVVCQFKVIAPAEGSTTAFEDDFEPDGAAWTLGHGVGTVDWSLSTTTPRSPTHAMFASNPNVVSDQYLAMTNPVVVPAGGELSFWHSHNLESGFDGGVVEYSTNGTTWTDVGAAKFLQNGYNATISTCCSNPIGGRQAFSGNIGGAGTTYRESVVDLTFLAGQSVRFRFRTGTDTVIAATGWRVDDVFIGNRASIDNTATATSPNAKNSPVTASSHTEVQGSAIPGRFTPLTPARILDTRGVATGVCTPSPCGIIGPGGTLSVQVAGQGGVPANGVLAVVANVTVTETSTASVLTAFPSDAPLPVASNLNFVAGQTLANQATVKVGADGRIKIHNSFGTVHVIVDVAGYYDDGSLPAGSRFNPVTPARILDTRNATGACTPSPCAVVGPDGTVSVQVAGRGGVPGTGVGAVTMNVTITEAGAASHLTAFPSDAPLPVASNLNYLAGQTVPNLVTVKVGADGRVKLHNHAGTVHVVADVAGWYGAPGAPTGALFMPVVPARTLDTRNATGACTPSPCGGLGSGGSLSAQVAGTAGVPPTGASAVVMNVTITEPSAPSVLTVHPSDAALPVASNLNFVAGQTVPNAVAVKLGADGRVNVHNSFGTTHVVADVAGWFGSPGPDPTLAPGNILVSTNNTLREFTPSGGGVRTITVPDSPADDRMRDIVAVGRQTIHAYDGTFDPYLSSHYLQTTGWLHRTFAGWSTVNNVSYGGIAAAGGSIFVTDMDTAGDAPRGVVRFPEVGGEPVRFATDMGPVDLTVGLDGLLYVLAGQSVRVYDPSSLAVVRNLTLAGFLDVRALAVTAAGHIYAASWDGNVYHFDPNGAQLQSKATGVSSLTDINLASDGVRIVVGSWFGAVITTDVTLANVSSFSAGSSEVFVDIVS